MGGFCSIGLARIPLPRTIVVDLYLIKYELVLDIARTHSTHSCCLKLFEVVEWDSCTYLLSSAAFHQWVQLLRAVLMLPTDQCARLIG